MVISGACTYPPAWRRAMAARSRAGWRHIRSPKSLCWQSTALPWMRGQRQLTSAVGGTGHSAGPGLKKAKLRNKAKSPAPLSG